MDMTNPDSNHTAYEGRFCEDDVDGCRDLPCFPGVECTDNPAPQEGATCGSCPQGYSQIGGKCLGKFLLSPIHSLLVPFIFMINNTIIKS